MKKDDIRRNIRAHKALLTDDERERQASDVFGRLEKSAAFIMAEKILMYHSLHDEISTHSFLEKWSGIKQLFLPRVNGVNLDILPYDRTTLHTGSFKIEEPTGNATVDISVIDLVVVPAVAFDHAGNRVGRGKGFYDRLLSGCKATKVGVGYDFQLVDEIDAENHDVRMDIVITSSNYLVIRPK